MKTLQTKQEDTLIDAQRSLPVNSRFIHQIHNIIIQQTLKYTKLIHYFQMKLEESSR